MKFQRSVVLTPCKKETTWKNGHRWKDNSKLDLKETRYGNIDAEGKRPLRRSRHRKENNIKMDLKEIEYNNLQPGGKRSLRQTSCRCEDIIRIYSEVKNERVWVGIILHRVEISGGVL